eukprot:NODE_496_length_2039_cov_117.128643_g391_i0.p1 GENE.NODE_496_length_2039_cov_117.128643_g391_i0~~NODE_496_length_2039_cov_117.128643_g391_i0.p1  ORF type:complete len:585 (-),score=256.18 NODE_496_length_2039_cov_117.128643_g391_i0:145-1899(-)
MTYRPPSQAGGVAQSRAGLGSAYMYGAGNAGVGVGLATNLNVQGRPVSSQGMKGMAQTSGTAGPGRQVADKSFYIARLREKNGQLQAELERMYKQLETLERGGAGAADLDRKYKGLTDEQDDLQGKLATINIATEYLRDDKDLDKLKKELVNETQMNQAVRNALDAIFRDRSSKEAKVTELENASRQIEADIEKKIDQETDSADKLQEYRQLREENRRLLTLLEPMQMELDKLTRSVTEKNQTLKQNQQKQAAVQLQQRRRELQKTKDSLLDEIARSETGMLPDEKTRIFNKVKSDTTELEAKTKMLENVKKDIESLNEQMVALESDLADKGDRAGKYMELEAKDREMTEFIDKFEETKKEQLHHIAECEEIVVGLLEHISGNLAAKEQLPDSMALDQMRSDLHFKQQQTGLAENTYKRLQQELEMRKRELEKVNNLDSKIGGELDVIKKKAKEQEDDIKVFGDIARLRAQYSEKMQKLRARKDQMLKQKDSLKSQIAHLSTTDFDPLKNELLANETQNTLQEMEAKIRMQQTSLFGLSEFIAQKGAESDYMPLKVQCLSLMEQINKLVCEEQTKKPPSSTVTP